MKLTDSTDEFLPEIKNPSSLIGEQIEGELVQSIHDLKTPPLAPATIAAKGFDKPLIGVHGLMVRSVTHRVKK